MFDVKALATTIAAHGPTARIVVAAHEGSSPREVGAAMLVWQTGQSGTIGGGALEWEAATRARAMTHSTRIDRYPLGPTLGQCCGGAVTLLTEVYDQAPTGDIIARSTDGRPMPLAVKRLLDRARGAGQMPHPQLIQGWFIEPTARPQRHLWVWGAG
ncbi:MAG: XdhC family protein, partial [Paracoccaceae bacterium]